MFHTKAKVGDVCLWVNNKHVYLSQKQLKHLKKSSILNTAIGVVFYEDNDIVKIVSGGARTKSRWASAMVYKLPSDYCLKKGKHYFSLLKYYSIDTEISRETSSKNDITDILNNIFEKHQLEEWHAFIRNGDVYIAYYGTVNDQVGYDLVIDNMTVSRATSYDAELPQIFGYCYNIVGQRNWVCGMNRTRMEEHCKYGTGKVFNPLKEDVIDGVKKLYSDLPVSLSYYSGSSSLQKAFSSYSRYLDACMVDISSAGQGVMTLRDGMRYTNQLAKNVIPRYNDTIREYPAAYVASEYSCNIKEYNDKGQWWLPTMYDLALLMQNIDIVNASMNLVKKWKPIDTSAFYWSCCPNSSYYVWFYHCDGMTDANNMEGADINGNLLFNVLPITEIPR